MDYRFKTTPFQHQLDALTASWNKEVWALFMEMGTGKTKVCIDNIAILFDKGKINSALIIVPNGINAMGEYFCVLSLFRLFLRLGVCRGSRQHGYTVWNVRNKCSS